MPGQSSKRWNIWTPLLFFLLLIIGISIGFYLHTWLGYKRPITTVIERNDRLEEIINLIGERYVDTISTDSLYEDAIAGILKHLDPHTSYIPAREMAEVTASLDGNFKGIGIEYYIIRDTIMVTAIIKNGPAADAGVLIGDKLIRVDSTLVAGTGISGDQITRLLRGKEDSKVALTLLRPEHSQAITRYVKRSVIPLNSIDVSYMIDQKTGYIRINRFSATTYREFMKALHALKKKGMNQLVLDLRQNPGGYLDAATAIADELIGGNKLLVYTRGRAMPREEYRSEQKGAFEEGRLAVLIDEGSASASEILAGAVQDWDRGVLIGRRTYGKGLVQEQYELGDGSALRLTIARYYTPTGRSIQRPYDNGREAYAMDYFNRFLPADSGRVSPLDTSRRSLKYFTEETHREVFGGGGILPDVIVSFDNLYAHNALYRILSGNQLNESVFQFFAHHKPDFSGYASYSDFDKRYAVSPVLLDQIKVRLEKEFPAEARYVWSDAAALSYLKSRVKALIARLLYGNSGFFRSLNEQDRILARALSVLKTDEYSKIIGREGS
jgi:carboxyl-terminal processing protease